MEKIRTFIEIIRPKQWYKNLVVFLGIIFSGNLLDFFLLWKVIQAFFVLILFSGVNYIINDLYDIEKDKKHPRKKFRPLASGKISPKLAIIYAVFLFFIAGFIALQLNFLFFIISVLFFLLGLSYSLTLKKFFLVDIIVIGINFVLRALLGAVVIDVIASGWLILSTFLLALLLVLGKRKAEIFTLGKKAVQHREVLKYYSPQFIDTLLIIVASTLLISYSIYSIFNSRGFLLITTIPVAMFLLFRYIYHMFYNTKSLGDPHEVFEDKQMVFALSLWTIQILVILYLF